MSVLGGTSVRRYRAKYVTILIAGVEFAERVSVYDFSLFLSVGILCSEVLLKMLPLLVLVLMSSAKRNGGHCFLLLSAIASVFLFGSV